MYCLRSPINPLTTQGKFGIETSPIFTLQDLRLTSTNGAVDSIVRVNSVAALFIFNCKSISAFPFLSVLPVKELMPSDNVTFTTPSLSVFSFIFPVTVSPNSICCHLGNS